MKCAQNGILDNAIELDAINKIGSLKAQLSTAIRFKCVDERGIGLAHNAARAVKINNVYGSIRH